MGARITTLVQRWKASRIARMLSRYSIANGAMLSGGIAFSALFSIAAALIIGFAAFTLVVGNNEELRNRVVEAISDAVPGLISVDGKDAMLSPDQLAFSGGTGIAGVIAVLVLLNTATRVPKYLRNSVRAMFGLVEPSVNPVVGKLRDLLGFIALAVSVLVTSVLGIVAGSAARWILDLVDQEGSTGGRVVLRATSLLVVLIVDMLVFVWIFRGLAGVKPKPKDLWLGAFIGAIGTGIMRYLGTSAVGSVQDNPLLASYAAIATLLLWINLVVRLTLMMAAWIANPPEKPVVADDAITHEDETPNFVTVSEPKTLEWEYDPVTGRVWPTPPPPEPEYWGGLIGWTKRKWRGFRDA